jgi:acetyl-CoA carboxylase biotin carboxylase subunit
LKAQRGGGGIGIRVVNGQINFEEMMALSLGVQKQMAGAFSDMDFFLEKYLPEAKHIEFQVLGDGKNYIHLGERECSVQRRFQKLLEEAPSSFLDDNLRQEMGGWACRICREVHYHGAATIEFLVGKDKQYYFMEINPRIQVEHPVTEAITGIDIVEQQIRVARSERLAFSQESILINGWAIEARVNAEDSQRNFMPSPGTVSKYIAPGGQGVFVHSFLQDGQEIYPYFDSLLAKIIATGKNRKEAIGKLKRALGETVIEGVATTIPFFQMLLDNQDFISGNFYTNFIEKSGIAKELMIRPYLAKKIACNGAHLVNEEIVADLVRQIFQQMKKEHIASGITTQAVSKWVLADRAKMGEEE